MLFDPRPIQRPTSKLLQDLTAARELVKRDWVKYSFEVHGAYCAIGAVEKVVLGEVVVGFVKNRTKAFKAIIDALYEQIPQGDKIIHTNSCLTKQKAIASFNDRSEHKQRVLDLFDRAIQAEINQLETTNVI